MIRLIAALTFLMAAAAPIPAGQQSETLLLKAGTAVPLVTVGEVDTRTRRQGDRVDFLVASDVVVAGRVAIPKGAPALGEVSFQTPRAKFGQSGRIEVRLLYARAGDRIVRLDGTAGASGGEEAGAAAVASAVAASMAGMFISGDDGTIPAGTAVTGYVHRDLTLPPSR